MERLETASIIISFIEELDKKGSWCGETHLQKSMYFLQHLADVPTGFNFILYKHGPFSFDFRDELTAMRIDGLLDLHMRVYPYSPGILPTENGKKIRDHFSQIVQKYSMQMEFVAGYLGEKNVAELERMGTALLVTLQNTELRDQTERAQEISRLKPHIPVDNALLAIQQVDNMKDEFQRTFAATAH